MGAAKGKGKKERYTHLNAEFQRIARRDKKAFLRLSSGINEKKKKRSERQSKKGKIYPFECRVPKNGKES